MRIAFYKAIRPWPEALFSYGVRFWTHGPYSHCEAVFSTDESGVSMCASSSFLDGGVRYKAIALDPEHWDFIEFPFDETKIRAWFDEHLGQPYDVIGLLAYIGPRGSGQKNKWYCSDAIGAAAEVTEQWRFDPNAFAALLRTFLRLKNNEK